MTLPWTLLQPHIIIGVGLWWYKLNHKIMKNQVLIQFASEEQAKMFFGLFNDAWTPESFRLINLLLKEVGAKGITGTDISTDDGTKFINLH